MLLERSFERNVGRGEGRQEEGEEKSGKWNGTIRESGLICPSIFHFTLGLCWNPCPAVFLGLD